MSILPDAHVCFYHSKLLSKFMVPYFCFPDVKNHPYDLFIAKSKVRNISELFLASTANLGERKASPF